MKFYSLFYKGFLLQQTAGGWFINNFPDWCRVGPMQSGPFQTSQDASKQVDRLIRAGS